MMTKTMTQQPGISAPGESGPQEMLIMGLNMMVDSNHLNPPNTPQPDRVPEMAATIGSIGTPDMLFLSEIHVGGGVHCGERLAKAVCPDGILVTEPHNRGDHEHIGVLTSLGTALDVNFVHPVAEHPRKAVIAVDEKKESVGVGIHWNFGFSPRARRIRQQMASGVMDILRTDFPDYSSWIVGDFNEPAKPVIGSGRRMLHRNGFTSAVRHGTPNMGRPTTVRLKGHDQDLPLPLRWLAKAVPMSPDDIYSSHPALTAGTSVTASDHKVIYARFPRPA